MLPGANCGGCGYPGCAGFAGACVKADSLEGMLCPVGGAPVMAKIATILGKEAVAAEPKVAVVRCNGTCQACPKTNKYDGVKSCAIASALYGGETGCTFGCLGYGDCVKACNFDAIHINPETGLPEVDEDKCTAERVQRLVRKMLSNCVKKDRSLVVFLLAALIKTKEQWLAKLVPMLVLVVANVLKNVRLKQSLSRIM